jgi:hypothetical protein
MIFWNTHVSNLTTGWIG